MDRKIMKKIAREILPPFIHETFRKLICRGKNIYNPTWHTVRDGNLKGRQIFIDSENAPWQKEMLEGKFDHVIFDYLKTIDLKGKVVFEIGAQIGYHAMNFACLVGESGAVYAFEPNMFNLDRMNLILTKNQDLRERIRIFNFAVSDNRGEVEFYLTPDVDKGTSSGSFIESADTYYARSHAYLELFERVKVKTVSLDDISSIGIAAVPDIIKIDVEGAESSVLLGGVNLLKKHKPLLFIEIHSIYNMLKAYEILSSVRYNIELIREEADGRCFIAAN